MEYIFKKIGDTMKKNKIPKECINKWVLFNASNKILFCSKDIVKVIEEGEKYGAGKVTIQKGMELGTCFL